MNTHDSNPSFSEFVLRSLHVVPGTILLGVLLPLMFWNKDVDPLTSEFFMNRVCF